MRNRLKGYQKGFTLLEMLLVIAMIAILAGIVIVAINPGRQLAQARNAQRASDLRAIHSAVNQFYIDNRDWPADLETVTTLEEICDTGAEASPHSITCGTLIDLSMLVPTYISAIPSDPQGAITALIPFIKTAHAQTTGVGNGYQIAVNPATQMVVLSAPKSTEYGLNTVTLGDVDSSTTFTLNFNANGGISAPTSESRLGGSIDTLPVSEPTYSGYSFLFWNTSSDGTGTTYAPGASFTMPTSNTTLYAIWSVDQFALTFDSAGGTTVDPIVADFGATITPPADPIRTGYTFTGWDPAIPATMPAENSSHTAQWDINQYTLTFNTDGGNTISPITQDYNTAITAPADPTKSGYTFLNWSPVIPANMPANNQTHTANWEAEVVAGCNDPATLACWSAQGNSLAWGPRPLTTGAQSDTNGKLNTQTLIDREESFPAAQFCADSTHGGYTDWYLPAKDQLLAGWTAHGEGTFTSHRYWSSTEDAGGPGSYAWYLFTYYASMGNEIKDLASSVRCLR